MAAGFTPSQNVLLNRFSTLMLNDENAAADVLAWSEWDDNDWAQDFISGLSKGDYDNHLKSIYAQVKRRMSTTGYEPASRGTDNAPAASSSPSAVVPNSPFVVGKHYKILKVGSRRSKWDGCVVKLIEHPRMNSATVKTEIVKLGDNARYGRGAAVQVGQRLRAAKELLQPIMFTGFICAGTVQSSGAKRPCPTQTEVTHATGQCVDCVAYAATVQEARKREQDRREREVAIALAEAERDAREAKEQAKKLAAIEAAKPKPGKRRVMRRG
jgi:hypothetical protein